MTTITKEKIALMLASKLGLSATLCEQVTSAIFTNILEIAKNQKLTLKNFGSFEVRQKKPRPGINFHTRLPITIKARKILRFTPSINLKASVNDFK